MLTRFVSRANHSLQQARYCVLLPHNVYGWRICNVCGIWGPALSPLSLRFWLTLLTLCNLVE